MTGLYVRSAPNPKGPNPAESGFSGWLINASVPKTFGNLKSLFATFHSERDIQIVLDAHT